MSTPLDQLRTDPPRTGRIIREDGLVINEADAFDIYVDAFRHIGAVHGHTHSGIVFNISRKMVLTSGQTVYFVGITKENVIHFNHQAYNASEGGIEVSLYKGATYTAGTGTQAAGINRNDLSSKESTLEIYEGATVTDDGGFRHLLGMPASATPAPTRIAQSAAEEEWLLMPNTVYALKIVNTTTATITLYADMTWYEPGLLL